MLELRVGPGRRSGECFAEVVRELAAADLVLLEGERGIQPRPIDRLRDRHHSVAKLLASGKSLAETAAIVGMNASRISVLRGDPTFAELVRFYQREAGAEYVELHTTLAGISLDAAIILRERLEEDPDDLTVGQLMELTKMGADRTGLGPSSNTNVNVNVNLASRLEEARKRVAARRMIDVTPQEAAE